MSAIRKTDRLLGILLFLALFLLLPFTADAKRSKESRRPLRHVLILTSYHKSHDWTGNIIDEITLGLESLPERFDSIVVDLNALLVKDAEQMDARFDTFLPAIKKGYYAMIVALDDDAVDLLIQHYAELPRDVPIVFAGYEKPLPDLHKRFPNMTGVFQEHRPAATIKLALALYPKAQNVIVLADQSAQSQRFKENLKEADPSFSGVNLIYLDGESTDMGKTFSRIATIQHEAESVVLLSPWRGLDNNAYQSVAAFGTDLAQVCAHPFFTSTDVLFNYGALGGVITDSRTHGRETAALVRLILNGRAPDTIEPVTGKLRPCFDYRLLKDEKCDLGVLPPDTAYINRPPSFFLTHRRGTLLGLLFLAFWFAWLMFFLAVKRRHVATFSALLRAYPGSSGVLNRQERVLFSCEKRDCRGYVYLRSIVGNDYPQFSRELALVFSSGENRSFEFGSADSRKAVSIVPLPKRVFHEDAAVWFTRDITDEYRQRRLLQDTLKSLEFASMLTSSSYFKIDVATRRVVSLGEYFQNLWPNLEVEVVTLAKWIHPDDLERVRHDTKRLLSGEISMCDWQFRFVKGDTVRHYRALGSLDRTDSDHPYVTGVIQDTTDIILSAEKLRDNLAMWDISINSLPIAFFAKDADDDFRYVLCNDVFARIMARPRDEIVGKTDRELLDGKECFERKRKMDREVMTLPMGRKYEETERDPDGVVRSYQKFKKPFTGSAGHRLLIGVASDVSRLSDLMTIERFNSKILSEVVRVAGFDSILKRAFEELSNELQCDRILLVKCNENGLLRLYKQWRARGVPELNGDELQRLYNYWDRNIAAVSEGRTVAANDCDREPFKSVTLCDSEFGTKSFLLEPTFIGDTFVGCLVVCHCRQRHLFTSRDRSIVKSCADVLAVAEMRNRQEQSLRQSKETLQIILDTVNIPIWLFDRDGKLVQVNRHVLEMVNLPLEDIKRGRCCEVFQCSLGAGKLCPVRQGLKDLKSHRTYARFGGHEYQVETNPVFDSKGRLVYVVKAGVDITDVNNLVRKQKTINFCLDTFFREPDFEKGIRKVLENVCEYLGGDAMAIGKLDADGAHVSPWIDYRRDEKRNYAWPVSFPFDPSDEWYRKYSRDEPLEIANMANPEESRTLGTASAEVERSGVKSLYGYGVEMDGVVTGGVCVFYYTEPVVLNADRREILRNASSLINAIWKRHTQQERLQQSYEQEKISGRRLETMLQDEKTLRLCLDGLFNVSDSKEGMRIALEALQQRLGAHCDYVLRYDMETRTQEVYAELAGSGVHAFPADVLSERFVDSWWYKTLLEKREVWLGDSETIAPDGPSYEFARNVREHGIRSAYLAGIFLHDKPWGNIGIFFEKEPRAAFSPGELRLVHAIVHILEVMLARQETQTTMVETMRRAEAANIAKSYFLSSMSHEIRTPLNAVIGYTELLHDNGLRPEERNDYLTRIGTSADALLELINDILDLSKLEADQMDVRLEPCDFNALARSVMQAFSFRLVGQRLEERVDIVDMPTLMLDTQHLRQILFNLIGNAAKFTERGSITLEARFIPNAGTNVGADKETNDAANKGTLRCSVIDTGIGISHKDMDALMEPFVQLTRMRGTYAMNKGTGLGLPICKRLVEKMNGKMTVASTVGQGSTFTFELYDVEATRLAPSETEELKPGARDLEIGPDPIAAGIRSVLLVDDVEMNLKMLKVMCVKLGIGDVVCVDTISAAWDECAVHDFDLVLTDMWMPAGSGEALAEKLRADKRTASLPIFAVTADLEVKTQFNMSLFDGLLLKPITQKRLREVVMKGLAKKRAVHAKESDDTTNQ